MGEYMQRYFIDEHNLITNNTILIDEADSHHIKDVMRMHVGENVIACIKGTNKIYLCEIENISKQVSLRILEEKEENNELAIKVSIAHGLVKRDKQEEVIRRLVELGAYRYIPVVMDRSVIKLKKEEYKFKNDRLERIIKEASEQAERNDFLILNDVLSFNDLVKSFNEYDLVLFAHARKKDDLSLKKYLNIDKSIKNILVIIGPEGGFSEKEENILFENDKVHTISLGKRVLRTETAPLAAMAILAFIGENDE